MSWLLSLVASCFFLKRGTTVPPSRLETSLGHQKNVVFLSTLQVLEDFANLLKHIKKELPQAANCPVLAFGGSYGGTLTATFRSKFPELVTGGVASSSEMGYYDQARWAEFGIDEFTFSGIVAQDYHDADPRCLDAVDAAVTAINSHPIAELVKIFRVCKADGLGPNQPAQLFQYALEGLPQLNYPYAIGTLPANPVSTACHRLTTAVAHANTQELIYVAAEIVGEYVGTPAQAQGYCIPTFVEGPGGLPGDGPGPDSWGYQSCTETLHPFSSRSSVRNYTFNFNQQAQLCRQLFSATPSLYSFYDEFGGFGLVNTTSNMIWSSGALDPWGGGALRGPSVFSSNHFFFRMEGAAHHLDLKKPNAADPSSVTQARTEMQKILFGYIVEHQSKVLEA